MQISTFKKPDMIIALSALLVSLVTAAATIHAAYTSRQYARASLWPNLVIGSSFNDQGFSYLAINRGTGPARIETMQVKVHGKPVKNWQELLNYLPGQQFNTGQSQLTRMTVTANQVVEGFAIKNADAAKQLYKLNEHITISACYCSVYDDCWLFSTVNNQSEAVAECLEDDKSAFTN